MLDWRFPLQARPEEELLVWYRVAHRKFSIQQSAAQERQPMLHMLFETWSNRLNV
jgi:hypothetical protein